MNPIDMVLILVGLFCGVGAVLNWEWLLTSRNAQLLAKLVGGQGRVRGLYLIAGIVLVGFGIMGTFGLRG